MSNIEWTDDTWNPVIGCTPVSPGCLNCYAASMAIRLEAMGTKEYQPRVELAKMGTPYDSYTPERTVRIAEKRAGRAVFTGDVRTLPERLLEPLKWRTPRMVFVCSMSDLFHESVPFEYVDKVWAVMALCPQHAFQVLTKRPDRMAEYLNRKEMTLPQGPVWRATVAMKDKLTRTVDTSNWNSTPGGATVPLWPLPNVWLGTSTEDQTRADERIPHLLRCPAKVRFISAEPLLGSIDLKKNIGGTLWMGGQRGCSGSHHGIGTPECPRYRHHHHDDRCRPGLDWVIVGGESGPGARPCNVAWIRSIVRQCKDAGVACFMKQLGPFPGVDPIPDGPVSHATCMDRSGSLCAVSRAVNGDTWVLPPDSAAGRKRVDRVPSDWLMCRRMNNRKGGDPAEWPEDLRVREWPKAHAQRKER